MDSETKFTSIPPVFPCMPMAKQTHELVLYVKTLPPLLFILVDLGTVRLSLGAVPEISSRPEANS